MSDAKPINYRLDPATEPAHPPIRTTDDVKRRWIGHPLPRKEDPRLLRGLGQYVDDLTLPRMAHASFVRSTYARARIVSIDTTAAQALPGVVGVITGAEFATGMKTVRLFLKDPPGDRMQDPGMAVDRVVYAGEAVAVVIAESKYLAKDAAELVNVTYEPLDPIMDPFVAAEPGAPLVHEPLGTNVVWDRSFAFGDPDSAFASAAYTAEARIHFHRYSAAPLETYAVLASWDEGRQLLTLHCNSAHPGREPSALAPGLGLKASQIRVVCGDNGGSFGNKNNMYPYLAALSVASRRFKRPIKWLMERSENLQASAHSNDMHYLGRMAFDTDGRILGIAVDSICDQGAFLRSEPKGATNWIRQLSSGYDFQHVRVRVRTVLTNKCPVASMRSYGKQQYSFLLESLIEKGARHFGLDPAEIRLLNLVRPEQMPYRIASGSHLDGGDYPGVLRAVMQRADYPGWRERQRALRGEGRLLGVGVAVAQEAYGANRAQWQMWDSKTQWSSDIGAAWIRVDNEGNVSAAVDSMNMGHGHETTTAQIVADYLKLHPDQITVLVGFDTWGSPFGDENSGTFGSRHSIVHHGALAGAARRMAERIKTIGAVLLEAAPEDTELEDGASVRVKGTDRRATLRQITFCAWRNNGILPHEVGAGLVVHHVYGAPARPFVDPVKGIGTHSLTYSYGAAVCVAEVDRGTGHVKLIKFSCIEDPGLAVNPLIVEGQIHGQCGHQIGAALFEKLQYDDNGQLVTSTFKDYLVPTAADLPSFDTGIMETRGLFTELGARGMAEGGGIPLIAVINAVRDALAPLGIEVDRSHVAPEELYWLIRRAEERNRTATNGVAVSAGH